MQGNLAARLGFGLRRPDLIVRRLRGREVNSVSLSEISRSISDVEVVLEAGGNNGTDTSRLATLWPQAMVHSFEPHPRCFEALQAATRGFPNVRAYPMALADSTGELDLYVSADIHGRDGGLPQSSSLFRPKEHLTAVPEVVFDETITVPTTTIDQWADQNGVTKIDFAWLDMQGTEISALSASPNMLKTLRGVYMEVSRIELYSGAPKYDEIISWMSQAGFRVLFDRVPRHWGNVLFVR